MLPHTFCHVPGIGVNQEEAFWQWGILNWQDLTPASIARLSKKNRENLFVFMEESIKQLEHKNPHFFLRLLPVRQHWRVFPHFLDSTAYLDIETTGLSRYKDHITCIALYHQGTLKTFSHRENLDEFPEYFSQFSVVVTYNGKAFDLPFLEHAFNKKFHTAHLDLRPFLQNLGFHGGLKACEKALGICRHGLEGVNGRFAVSLWKDYEEGKNQKALETLLAYNIEDTVNLERLMRVVYNRKLEKTPFDHEKLPEDLPLPQNPFSPHEDTIQRLLKEAQPST